MPAAPNTLLRPHDGVEILERDTVFQGYFRIDRYILRFRRFDGSWTAPIMREVFERGHAAAVLLYDPARDQVALAEQFRPGAYAAGWEPWQVEIVAGIVDEGETREAAALREAREEAGTEVAEMIPMLDLIASPGGASETLRVFLARVDAARIAGHHGLEHEAEDIRIHKISAAEALAWTEQGRIRNAVSVAAIQWLALHKEEVRKRWGAI